MPPSGPPPDEPSPRAELRDALFTYGPAILIAFVMNWALVEQRGWIPRRALGASILAGIGIALILQRAISRARGSP